jgi:hypothetical protein
MKNILLLLLAVLLIGVISSCEMDLITEADYTDYAFSGLDENGGSWTTTLVATPGTIVVGTPADVTSAGYLAELAALKTAASRLNSQQIEAIEYWTNNPILRWNEIALELAAKYNIIPAPNPDGTYTLPSATDPGRYPNFPFAHPAYTCRMLAYLSVAQFDGLVVAWHYKYAYNRANPQQVDNTVPSAYGVSNLPSYPADGAVIATVSQNILSAMFPLEKGYLADKAAEHLFSLKWAGLNVDSDITAGSFIGTEIAKLALARASTDGMSKAQAPKPVSDSIKTAAFDRFGWQWDNLETPVRPVGLAPLFGNVRLWNLPSVELTRPPIPPAPGSAEFEVAAKELKDIQDNLTTEQRKIANWWSDGLGTYTPPGHWNKFAKDFIIKYQLNPLRSARTFAYMNMAIMDAGVSCWDAKYYYHYPRPIQTIPGFKTILGTPNFPSYTSGHSTFSAAAAEVLAYIFPAEATLCRDWAREAADSRVYAGIHYRFDAEVGIDQGIAVAQYTIQKAQADGAN